MARRKISDNPWDSDSVDELVDSLLNRAKDHYGDDNVYTGLESEQRIVGLKLPALSACYLFQSNIYPLSRMTQLVGLQASGKSTLMFEIFRWFRVHGGISRYLEVETKDSPEVRNAILNYDNKAVVASECDFLEDWQEGVLTFLAQVKDILDGTSSRPGPGRIRPFCCGVDSLMGKGCRDSVANIDKAGFAGRAFPVEALSISNFMRAMPQKIADLPVCIVGTNHLKPGTDQRGRPTESVPGGKSLKFQETFEIKLSRVSEIKRKGYTGYTVRMFTTKNSVGPDRKSVTVDILHWYDLDDKGELRLRSLWNWEAASINLLLEFQQDKYLYEKIMGVCDLHAVRTKGNRVWSSALGIPSDSPATFREAGIELEKRVDLLTELYKLLGIRRRMIFMPGEDYRVQRRKARDLALMDEAESSVTYKTPESADGGDDQAGQAVEED